MEYQLHQLAANNDFSSLAMLLQNGADPNQREPTQGFSPLHVAVASNNYEAARTLLEHGANPVIGDREGMTPFDITGYFDCHPAIVQMLIDHGGLFQYRGRNIPEKMPITPDGIPTEPGLLGRNEFWREASDADVISEIRAQSGSLHNSNSIYHEHSPLHMASGFERNATIINLLLDLGCDPNQTNHNGNTPLHLTAQRGTKEEVVRLFIDRGANPQIGNNEGNIPLHSAARDNHTVKVIEAMLRVTPDPLSTNLFGQTPLELAWQYRNDVATAILENY